MKKLLNLLFTAVILCSMLAIFTVPAAAESWTDSKTGEFYHVINNGSELKSVIEGCVASNKKIHLLLTNWSYDVDRINIDKTNHFVFETYDSTAGGGVAISSTDDDEPLFFISENAAGTVLEFETPNHIKTSHKGVFLYSRDNDDDGGIVRIEGKDSKIIGGRFEYGYTIDDDGGAIYVDAKNVTIDNAFFFDCYADVDGGAISVNRDNCKIKNCTFDYCKADGDGGAIYFCYNSDDGYVWNCKFIDCHADDGGAIYFGSSSDDGYVGNCTFSGCWADDGDCVVGDGDTEIYNCSPGCDGDDDDNYEDCERGSYRGSIFSSGNVWIIVFVFAVAVAIAVAVVITASKKKKAATANSATEEKSDEHEE